MYVHPGVDDGECRWLVMAAAASDNCMRSAGSTARQSNAAIHRCVAAAHVAYGPSVYTRCHSRTALGNSSSSRPRRQCCMHRDAAAAYIRRFLLADRRRKVQLLAGLLQPRPQLQRRSLYTVQSPRQPAWGRWRDHPACSAFKSRCVEQKRLY